jgi:hypothetical protein
MVFGYFDTRFALNERSSQQTTKSNHLLLSIRQMRLFWERGKLRASGGSGGLQRVSRCGQVCQRLEVINTDETMNQRPILARDSLASGHAITRVLRRGHQAADGLLEVANRRRILLRMQESFPWEYANPREYANS